MQESAVGNGMLVFMILEVKQSQGAQVLYVTVGVNGRGQRRSLDIGWSRN